MKRFFNWLGIRDIFNRGLIARIQIILCLLFVGFSGIFLVIRIIQVLHPALTSPHLADVMLELIAFTFGIITFWLIRSDRIQAASWVILGCLLTTFTMQVYFVGNPANDITGALGLQLIAILAILLLGRRARWIAVAVVIAIFIGLNALSTAGYLHPIINQDPLGEAVFSIFIWLMVSLIITVVLISALETLRREPQLLEQHVIDAERSQKKKADQKGLPFLSTHDALTGLYNRLFFETEFTRLENSRLYPISVIMIVVDRLIQINDVYGRSTGDKMLVDVARLFSKVFRQEDIISRYGGDEFAILLPSTDADIVKVIVNRSTIHINAYNKKHSKMPISLSMGASTANEGESLKKHKETAEKIMRSEYKKKAEGSLKLISQTFLGETHKRVIYLP